MPIFRSTYEALTFAFNFNGQNVVTATLGLPPAGGNGRGLGGLDGAAEAGNIKRIVKLSGEFSENVAIARFMPKRIPCSCRRLCCQGWIPNLEWRGAIRHITREIQGVCFDGHADSEYRNRVVGRYFMKEAEREPFVSIAAVGGFSERTVKRHFEQVRQFLGGNKTQKGSEQILMDRIDAALRDAGVVGEID